ncbi:uncharacterized protein [Dermacentor albipictus]
MLGFNGTIFAFGQTSSGKTYTMMGNSSQPGLIPLAINAIFDIIQNEPEREFLLRVSYMEIYNENILDLLDNGDEKHLQIRDNVDGQPVIVDLTEVPVGSKEEIESAMNNGERRRHVANTEANQRSSRSHSIFRMVIESSFRDGTDGAVAIGQLNLVDLAGSERTEQCGDLGERFRESTRINLSLTFLTQVISKLSRGERGHINFRDSKLTRILRNSLGGNALTAIVCTVNPCCLEQTLRTLQFASSAKKIQNTPKVNEIVTNDAQIRRYHMQIEELKGKVRDLEGSTLTKTLQEKNSQIDELKNQVRSLEKKLLVSTLPQCRKQRRETWAAPRSIDSPPGAPQPPLPFFRALPASKAVESPEVIEERGRLSTVMEESESSFHAISHEAFEKQLQREERERRSALHSKDNTLGSPSACSNTACAERIALLENELSIVRKKYEELKEMTRLGRLMCTTSRRPASSDKLGETESAVEGQLGRPELTDAAVSCHLYFEQLVECHVQTEPFATVCSAMEVAKQEAECVFTGVGNQVSPVKICSVQSCGVQTFVDAKDHESQVNTSLADNYRADFGTQAVMAMPSGICCGVQAIPDVEDYASQVDGQFTRNGATDCAVQCELLAPDDDIKTPAPNAVDCEVQATLLVQECATQTEQCLLHCDLRDSDVQVSPSMRDSAVQVEQPSRSNMLHYNVQTTSWSICDSSTQPECQVPRAVGVTCEVQAVPVTRSCASQVNASLTSQVTPVLKPATTPFATGGSSQFRMFSVKSILADRPKNSMPLDASASNSASGSAIRQQFGYPGGDILAALQASQRKFNKDREGGELSSSGHQKVVDPTAPAQLTPVLGRKTWLQQSKMVSVSVAVQVDIWSVQEMQELHQERRSMQLRMEKYKKANQEWASQYKLREKASKKREMELNAIICQLTNEDAETSVVAACGSRVAAVTSAGGEALRKPGVPAKPLATESSASLAQQLKAMTPRSREGARLVYFGRGLKEVQAAQLRASAASKTEQLASAERRHRAWAELSSRTGNAEPGSPLKDANQKSRSSAETPKEEVLDEMAFWPPMKFLMDDDENEDSDEDSP